MSRYSVELARLYTWVETRAAELDRKRAAPICNLIQGSPYSFEAVVLIDDAINRQARAERLAYMRGEPTPDENGALVGLLTELDSHQPSTREFLRKLLSGPETRVIGVPTQDLAKGPQAEAGKKRDSDCAGDDDTE